MIINCIASSLQKGWKKLCLCKLRDICREMNIVCLQLSSIVAQILAEISENLQRKMQMNACFNPLLLCTYLELGSSR